MVNRAAVILKYKEPMVRWINESDPYNDNPGITLARTHKDCTVYLITSRDAENIAKWLSRNFKMLFENELEAWYTDESLWPPKLSKKLFNEWFDVECYTMLLDTVGDVITDDEI